MCFVPLSERCCVDLNYGGFCESVCADKFIVGRVESDDNNADFAGNTLRTPREVTRIDS